jgi:putative alpha-1,2-mannosidase
MGFYPVAPGQNVYVLGSPLFSKAILHLDKNFYNADKLVIETQENSQINKYIQSVALNGEELSQTWFDHSVINSGATLTFKMGEQPNKNWGITPEDAPPSMSDK